MMKKEELLRDGISPENILNNPVTQLPSQFMTFVQSNSNHKRPVMIRHNAKNSSVVNQSGKHQTHQLGNNVKNWSNRSQSLTATHGKRSASNYQAANAASGTRNNKNLLSQAYQAFAKTPNATEHQLHQKSPINSHFGSDLAKTLVNKGTRSIQNSAVIVQVKSNGEMTSDRASRVGVNQNLNQDLSGLFKSQKSRANLTQKSNQSAPKKREQQKSNSPSLTNKNIETVYERQDHQVKILENDYYTQQQQQEQPSSQFQNTAAELRIDHEDSILLGDCSIEVTNRVNTKGMLSSASGGNQNLSVESHDIAHEIMSVPLTAKHGGDYNKPLKLKQKPYIHSQKITKTVKHSPRQHVQKEPLQIEYQRLDVAEQNYGARQTSNNNNFSRNVGNGNMSRKQSLQENLLAKAPSNRGSQTIINIQKADLFQEAIDNNQENHRHHQTYQQVQKIANSKLRTIGQNAKSQKTYASTMQKSQKTASALYYRQAKNQRENQQKLEQDGTQKFGQVQKIEVVYSRQGVSQNTFSDQNMDANYLDKSVTASPTFQKFDKPSTPQDFQDLIHNRHASITTELHRNPIVSELDLMNGSTQDEDNLAIAAHQNSNPNDRSIHSSSMSPGGGMHIAIFSKTHNESKIAEDHYSNVQDGQVKFQFADHQSENLDYQQQKVENASLTDHLLTTAGARPILINANFCPQQQPRDQYHQFATQQISPNNVIASNSTKHRQSTRSSTSQAKDGKAEKDGNQFQIVQVKDPLVLQRGEIQKLHEASGLKQQKQQGVFMTQNGRHLLVSNARRRNIKIKSSHQETNNMSQTEIRDNLVDQNQSASQTQNKAGIKVKIQYNGLVKDHLKDKGGRGGRMVRTTKNSQGIKSSGGNGRAVKLRGGRKEKLQAQLQNCLSMESAGGQKLYTKKELTKGLILSRLTKQPLPMALYQSRQKSAYQTMKESEAPRQTWQVVQQVSAVKSFLNAANNNNSSIHNNQQQYRTRDASPQNSKPNLLYKRPQSRPISSLLPQATAKGDDKNMLQASQSTNLNLNGHTMALNDQESYLASLRNKKELCRLKGQLQGIRSQTPQLIEAAFIEETISIARQSQQSFGLNNHNATDVSHDAIKSQFNQIDANREDVQSRNYQNLASRTANQSFGQSRQSQQMVLLEEKSSQGMMTQDASFLSQDQVVAAKQMTITDTSLDLQCRGATESNVPIGNKLKWKHSYLRHDPNQGIRNNISSLSHNQSSCNTNASKKINLIRPARSQSRQHQHRGSQISYLDVQGSMYSRSSLEDFSPTTPTRIPGVSAALTKGVLPRQYKEIKQAMKIITAQQPVLDGPELQNINSNLLKQVQNVNQVHQRMKEKAEMIKVETEALKEQLILRGLTDEFGQFRPEISQFTDKNQCYTPIGDALSQARYTHEQTNHDLDAYNSSNPIGVKLVLGDQFLPDSEPNSPEKENKDIIATKIEGARKVFDAAKLRSVLVANRETITKNSKFNLNNRHGSRTSQRSSIDTQPKQQAISVPPFTTKHKPPTQGRVLNIFLNVDGEIRRQSQQFHDPNHQKHQSDLLQHQDSRGSSLLKQQKSGNSQMALQMAQVGQPMPKDDYEFQLSPVSQENTIMSYSNEKEPESRKQSKANLDQKYGALHKSQSKHAVASLLQHHANAQRQSLGDNSEDQSFSAQKFLGAQQTFSRHILKHHNSNEQLQLSSSHQDREH